MPFDFGLYDVAEGILRLMQRSLLHPLDRLGIEPKLQLHCLRVMTTRLPIYRWMQYDWLTDNRAVS